MENLWSIKFDLQNFFLRLKSKWQIVSGCQRSSPSLILENKKKAKIIIFKTKKNPFTKNIYDRRVILIRIECQAHLKLLDLNSFF